ncbi:MAG: class I SAM-dependent methyltransferase [Exilibacterium sp.]
MNNRKADTKRLFSFDQEAQKWSDLYESGDNVLDYHFILRRNAAYRYTARHLSKNKKILDLGCGAGVFAQAALENGYRIDCVDMSADMLKLAGQRLEKYLPDNCGLFNAESEKLPFREHSYDAVVCLGMFGYLDNVDAALAEIHRVLKPGGLLILSVRNRRNQYVFDPVRLPKKFLYHIPLKTLRRVKRILFGRHSKSVSPAETLDRTQGLATKKFNIDILDSPSNLTKGVKNHSFSLTDFMGLGYGPLCFNNKQIVSSKFAIKMSDFLSRLFAAIRIQGFTRWFADISIYVFTKASGEEAEVTQYPLKSQST